LVSYAENPAEVIDAFGTRLQTQDDAIEDDAWPLYYTTIIFNSTLASMNLSNRMVILND
jgi:hypothetical protein